MFIARYHCCLMVLLAMSTTIIDMDGYWNLGICHILKGESHYFHLDHVMEQVTQLGFGRGDHGTV